MALATPDRLVGRVARVRALTKEAGADALLVTHLPNVFYLTNLQGSAAALVVTPDHLYFVTDFRYIAAVESVLASDAGYPNAKLVRVERTYDDTLAEICAALGGVRLGLEAAHLSLKRYNWLAAALAERAPRTTLAATDRIVERVRLCKDEHEIAMLRAGARLISRVARQVLDEVDAGQTEQGLAARIDWLLRDAGFERPAFETIVASGPNSARPHARAGGRRMEPGDLVLLDFGGVYDGYCVDLTRTVCLGTPGPDARRWHQAVAGAHAAAIASVRPGVRASSVDGAAREMLRTLGFGEAFGHSTGHGLGVELHEEPRIGKRLSRNGGTDSGAVDATLERGMVFTIEPGVYVEGRGGVRIEDDVLVTEQGSEVLTDAPRELVRR